MDADASLHGCIHGIFRQMRPIAVTISQVLNSYEGIKYLPQMNADTHRFMMWKYLCVSVVNFS